MRFYAAFGKFDGETAEVKMPNDAVIQSVTNDGVHIWVVYTLPIRKVPR